MEFYTLRSRVFPLFTIVVALFLAGCGATTPHPASTSEASSEKPFWVKHPEELSAFEAVGMSGVNFQGMHTQRAEAMAQARELLAQRIDSYVKSVETQRTQARNGQMKKSYISTTEAISNVLLSGSYQADAYIDERENLYVLVRVKPTPAILRLLGESAPHERALPPLQTKPFEISALLQRRCYAPSILRQITTKAPMHDGKPAWFFRPNENIQGMASIGIAEKISDTDFVGQRNSAFILAKTAIAKRIAMQLHSYNQLKQIVVHDERGEELVWELTTHTQAKVDNIVVKDSWMSPQTCELYLLVGEK